jgi:hypothetical protein
MGGSSARRPEDARLNLPKILVYRVGFSARPFLAGSRREELRFAKPDAREDEGLFWRI